MSLKTWKEEFYPFDAEEFEHNGASDADAVQHSLTKWIGLREEGLHKHGLESLGRSIQEIEKPYDYMTIDSSSCSLCVRYYNISDGCPDCPLQKTLGNVCDRIQDEKNRPYTYWDITGDPEPMIAALEETLRNELQ